MPASISFSSGAGGVDVVEIAPLEPLPENTTITLTVEGVIDLAGQPIVPFTSQFTTGSSADTERPFVAASSVLNGATDVPLNAVFSIEMSEPVDVQTMTTDGFRLFDHTLGINLTATRTLSANGRILTLAPVAPLAAGRTFSLILNNLEDMAGNVMFGTSFFFTTSFAPDNTPPTVIATSPAAGASAVPRNATIAIRFSEPIAAESIGGTALLQGGTPIPVTRVLSDANRALELIPTTLLGASISYTLSIQGIRDLSGNVLTPTVNVPFTTAGGADLVAPVAVATNPGSGDIDVPRNVVLSATFNERINPLSPGLANWRLSHVNSGQTVPTTRSVSADGRTVSLVPVEPLLGGTLYNGSSFTVEDLAGNTGSAFVGIFTTGLVIDLTGPTVQSIAPVPLGANVPVNTQVVAVFDEKLDRTSLPVGTVTLSPGRRI